MDCPNPWERICKNSARLIAKKKCFTALLSSLGDKQKINTVKTRTKLKDIIDMIDARSPASLPTLQTVQPFIERLIEEIEGLEQEIQKAPASSAAQKKERQRRSGSIERKKKALAEAKLLQTFSIGQQVGDKNGKAGKITALQISGRIPEALVLWDNCSAPVPESPRHLAKIDSDLFELKQLESVVEHGIEAFYQVGEALVKIRDRKLYKAQGYSDFRVYLEQRWQMKKTTAYQLINAAEVMRNLKIVKSVHHGGQNESVRHGGQNLPHCERIARELAKLPKEQQAAAWSKMQESAPENKVTTFHAKSIVRQLLQPNKTAECGEPLTLKPQQLVQIKSDRGRQDNIQLKGLDLAVAVVCKVNERTVDLIVNGQRIDGVNTDDLIELPEDKPLPSLTFYPSAEEYRHLVNLSKQQLIKRLFN